MQSERITQLDGMRFFMCMMIVLTHLALLLRETVIKDFYDTYLLRGGLAVDYFFVLSGYGIYSRFYNTEFKLSFKSSIRFAIERIRKIYPIYIISLVAGLCYSIPAWIKYNTSIIKTIIKISGYISATLTLCQSITGIERISHAMNGVCWFLSSLFISYMICPAFVLFVNKIGTKSMTIVAGIGVLLVIISLAYVTISIQNSCSIGNLFDDLYYGHPFIRCFDVLFGMLIARFVILGDGQTSIKGSVLCMVYLIYFVFYYKFHIKEFIRAGIDVLSSGLLLYGLICCNKGRIKSLLSNEKITRWGRKESMYIFLFHYPVIVTCEYIDEKIVLRDRIGAMSVPAWLIIIFIGTIIWIKIAKRYEEKMRTLLHPIYERLCRIFDGEKCTL